MKITFNHLVMVIFLLFIPYFTYAQQNITGVISDESGVPLPGVNVVIKGTNTGTTTDFNGNYSINASDTDILTFSFVGFIDQEIEVGNADSFNLSLQMGSDELDEVVLTGYGTTKRANLTNSVSK